MSATDRLRQYADLISRSGPPGADWTFSAILAEEVRQAMLAAASEIEESDLRRSSERRDAIEEAVALLEARAADWQQTARRQGRTEYEAHLYREAAGHVRALLPSPVAPAVGRSGDWIQTYTGKRFWPLDPRGEDLDLRDVAHSLSLECRYGGHCLGHYSVGQHSVFVSARARQLRVPRPEETTEEAEASARQLALIGLLHDAAEAYLRDLPAPVKRAPQMDWYRRAERRILGLVMGRYLGRLPADHEWVLVKQADLELRAAERRDFMAVGPEWSSLEGVRALPDRIRRASDPRWVEGTFLALAGELGVIGLTADEALAVRRAGGQP